MLTLTNLSKNSRTSALTLKAAKSAIQTLVIFDSYFRHCLPSLPGTFFVFYNATIIHKLDLLVNNRL